MKIKHLNIWQGEAGLATGIVMILSAILTTTALTILALSNVNSPRDNRYLYVHTAYKISHANIYAFGQNTHAWRATVAANKAKGRMTCVDHANPAVKCAALTYEPIDLRFPSGAATGAEYYNYNTGAVSTGSNDGFNLEGEPCNFKKDKITLGCLFGVTLRWWPYCAEDCRVGPEKISLQWFYTVPDRDQNNYLKTDQRFFVPINQLPLQGDIVSGNRHR